MIFLLAFDSVTHAGHSDSGVQKPRRAIESGYFGRGICAVPADIICRAYCGATSESLLHTVSRMCVLSKHSATQYSTFVFAP